MFCEQCGKKNQEVAKFCRFCGNGFNYENIDTNTNEGNFTVNKDKKLTGWVAFLGLGLLFGLISQLYNVYTYIPLLSQEYSVSGLKTAIQFEFVASLVFLVWLGYIVYLYFKKKLMFSSHYFNFLIAVIVYLVLDYFFVASLDTSAGEVKTLFDDALSDQTGAITRAVISFAVWGTYIKKSKQVQETFVNE